MAAQQRSFGGSQITDNESRPHGTLEMPASAEVYELPDHAMLRLLPGHGHREEFEARRVRSDGSSPMSIGMLHERARTITPIASDDQSVTHVPGQRCYPCRGQHVLEPAFCMNAGHRHAVHLDPTMFMSALASPICMLACSVVLSPPCLPQDPIVDSELSRLLDSGDYWAASLAIDRPSSNPAAAQAAILSHTPELSGLTLRQELDYHRLLTVAMLRTNGATVKNDDLRSRLQEAGTHLLRRGMTRARTLGSTPYRRLEILKWLAPVIPHTPKSERAELLEFGEMAIQSGLWTESLEASRRLSSIADRDSRREDLRAALILEGDSLVIGRQFLDALKVADRGRALFPKEPEFLRIQALCHGGWTTIRQEGQVEHVIGMGTAVDAYPLMFRYYASEAAHRQSRTQSGKWLALWQTYEYARRAAEVDPVSFGPRLGMLWRAADGAGAFKKVADAGPDGMHAAALFTMSRYH